MLSAPAEPSGFLLDGSGIVFLLHLLEENFERAAWA